VKGGRGVGVYVLVVGLEADGRAAGEAGDLVLLGVSLVEAAAVPLRGRAEGAELRDDRLFELGVLGDADPAMEGRFPALVGQEVVGDPLLR
jgi:hypothetical protein